MLLRNVAVLDKR